MTVALHWPAGALCVTSDGHVSVQAAPLVTTTLKLQETVLLAESVAVQVTVVVPTTNLDPEGGAHTVFTQLPVVVGGG